MEWIANTVRDGSGVYGEIFTYVQIIFLFSSALIVFIYLWKKGRLDFDEEAKYQMLKDDDDEDLEKNSEDKV